MSEWFEVPSKVSWVSNRTIVRCFDGKGNQSTVIDGATGLVWKMKEEDGKSFMAVDESCIPAGPYEFTGVFFTRGKTGMEGSRASEIVTTKGVSTGEGYVPFTSEGSPWSFNNSMYEYVTWPERQERIATCYGCELFNGKEGMCTADDSFMAWKTIRSDQVCPKDKWGTGKGFDPVEAEKRREDAAQRMTQAANESSFEVGDQKAFESEWEARRAGK